ncbi:MAG: hypothetical protein IT376_08775 [Polyangiaceae bacterium]|nr:hypothetical protein [Polyangiaceae bacterium]
MARPDRLALAIATLCGLSVAMACVDERARTGDAPGRSEPPPPASVLGATSAATTAAPGADASVATAGSAPPPRAPPAAFEAAPVPSALLAKLPSAAPIEPPGPVDVTLDRAWATRLAAARIASLRRNRGGATITLLVRFEDGARAVWKPAQSHGASNHRAEIAAYHLDRLLGLRRTAVVVGRRLPRAAVREHLVATGTSPEELARFDAEVRDTSGEVAGAMIAWHARPLADAAPPRDWAHDPTLAPERRLELADLLLFDALLDNGDRWSGGNVLSLGKGGPLVFLDNAAGFMTTREVAPRPALSRLRASCLARETTLAALERVGPSAPKNARLGARLGRSLARDPLAPVLDAAHLEALDRRVALVLEHLTACRLEAGARPASSAADAAAALEVGSAADGAPASAARPPGD